MEKGTHTQATRITKTAARALSAFGLAIAATLPVGQAATITFSGGIPGAVHYLSDGTTEIPTDGSFHFELGAFDSGFTPQSTNTDQWLDNWSPVTDPFGTPLPDATTDFTTLAIGFFPPFPGFASEVELDHNNAPFTAGTQGYVWGYDTRTDPGDAEWILMTRLVGDASNNPWLYPNVLTNPPSNAWSVGNADTTVVGLIAGPEMTTATVTIPNAVPEPSTALLAALATSALLCSRTRKHRP